MVQFIDEGPQVKNEVPSLTDSVSKVGLADDLLLGAWLERPLEIANFTWTTGTDFSEIFDPWTLFITDPRNINKIAYFNNMSCDGLCLKFLINGGPFYYGRVLVSYLPFANNTVSPVTDHMSLYAHSAPNISSTLISHSHRPHITLDPTLSQGGCFDLPFLWYNNYIEIPKSEWQHLGAISMQSFSELGTAGGTAESSLKIKVFAWMKSPRLSAPTTSLPTLPAQSTAGDEYVGLVSKPASAVSAMAGRLRDIPIIGQYARATSIGAGVLASAAKLMGFSRPNVLTELLPVRPTYVNDLAVVDKPEYVIKITTDSKQELSISPNNIGVGGDDMMSISNLVGKETFLGKCVWDTTSAEGYNLFSSLVTPMLYGVRTVPPSFETMIPTAMSYGALPFRYWKGNLKFRFQLVASQYHRGRVKIVYDIAAVPIATKTNSVYSRIIDIQETTDFTVTVGWNNPALMATVHRTNPIVFVENWAANSIGFAPDIAYDNGSISLFVENELMVPIPGVNAPATWLVWVSMENPVFNEPCSVLQQITPAPPYSAAVGEEEATPSSSLVFGDMGVDPNINQVVFGETITSYRALLKRYCDYVLLYGTGASASLYTNMFFYLRDFPLFPGYDVNGIHVDASSNKRNFVAMTLLNYLAMSHSSYRGGVRYKIHGLTSISYAPLRFSRENGDRSSSAVVSNTINAVANANAIASGYNQLENAWQGEAIANQARNPFLEVEAPFWYKRRFSNPKYYYDNSYTGNATRVSVGPVVGVAAQLFKVYNCAAEDFQLAMYTGPPELWLSSYNVY